MRPWLRMLVGLGACLVSWGATAADGAAAVGRILRPEGQVTVEPPGQSPRTVSTNLPPAPVWERELVETHLASSAIVELSARQRRDEGNIALKQLSKFRIPDGGGPLELLQGTFHFFRRATEEVHRWVAGDLLGTAVKTDFLVVVGEDGSVLVRVNEGVLDLRVEGGGTTFPVESGKAMEYQPATRTLDWIDPLDVRIKNAAQTFLHYPGVLHPPDLALGGAGTDPVSRAVEAYRHGDAAGALAVYRDHAGDFQSRSGRLFAAYLWLVSGQFESARALAGALGTMTSGEEPVRRALDILIRAVAGEAAERPSVPHTATEWLAESYYQQARSGHRDPLESWEGAVYPSGWDALERAREAARRACRLAPDFGYAWVRLAALEFGFGRIPQALEALRAGESLQGHNPAARALRGYLALASGRDGEARAAFVEALRRDPGLSEGWLGAGLANWRRPERLTAEMPDLGVGEPADGEAEEVRARGGVHEPVLQLFERAVAAEPSRSLLRSYLGKAYFEAAGAWIPDPLLQSNALSQLELAARLDPLDPTPHLYRGLVLHQLNRVNEAVVALETSRRLNDLRHPYRSRLLLDQDRAVRAANLAAVHAAAGMLESAQRRASDAVAAAPAEPGGHLFLANAFNELRDARLADLRYEPAVVSEYLLATLLSPVGESALSPRVSQQEYGRMLEPSRFGLVVDALVRSSRDHALAATHFGALDGIAYALEGVERKESGFARNTDIEQRVVSFQGHLRLSPADSLYFQAVEDRLDAGDTRRLWDPHAASVTRRLEVRQEPNLLAGLHHEWTPGHDTLLLVSSLRSDLDERDSRGALETWLLDGMGRPTNTLAAVCRAAGVPDCEVFSVGHGSGFDAQGIELQHLGTSHAMNWVAGVRGQWGQASVEQRLDFLGPVYLRDLFEGAGGTRSLEEHFHRIAGYGYGTVRVAQSLSLEGGLAVEDLAWPRALDAVPAAPGEKAQQGVLPKAGVRWEPSERFALRAAYAPSLLGYQQEASVRLEPSQVSGVNQAYRSVVPESLAGSFPGSRIDVVGVGANGTTPWGAHWGVTLERLWSDGERERGFYEGEFQSVYRAGLRSESFAYRELSASGYLAVPLDSVWTVGVRARVADADFHSGFPGLDKTMPGAADEDASAVLHEARAFVAWNHPSGWFAGAEAGFWLQEVRDAAGSEEGFGQLDLMVGQRFARRRAEWRVGIENLGDTGYQLHPVNLTAGVPRERVLYVRFRFRL